MAASWVAICNIGLTALGAQPITSLTQVSSEAQLCNSIYRAVVDEVTTEHDWHCAMARQDLAALSTAPDGEEWAYQFQLPASPKWLKVRGVDPDSPYDVMEDKLLSNEDEITVIFTKQITDPAMIPPALAYAMGMKIAEHLAFKITQNNTVTQYMEGKYERALLKAKWEDAHGSTRAEDQVEGSENKEPLDEVW